MTKKNIANRNKKNLFYEGGYFGGYPMPLGYPINGALDYNLAAEKNEASMLKAQNKQGKDNTFAGMPNAFFAYGGDLRNTLFENSEPTFALGGVLQSHGSDWGDGMTTIGAGQSHELNPNDGVQIGQDSEGVPNLVEEGETIFDDYVYSARIYADGGTLKKFHLPKKAKLTYADISKRLEKEIKERPNDPISRAAFKAQMEQLADEQERQKQEMEAERAKAAFEALSPEEQTALMQQKAQQDAMAEQAVTEQAMAEQQAMQQPSPEEVAIAQGQMSPEEIAMAQQAAGEVPVVAAYGGHLYADGGLKKKIYTLLGRATDKDFKEWIDEMGKGKLDYEIIKDLLEKNDWETLSKNDWLIDALGKENKTLAHSISLGNNLGTYVPGESDRVFHDPNRGNWDAQTYEGWKDSKDAGWLELVDKYGDELEEKVKDRKWFEDALRNTKAFKNTTEWLKKDPENMRRYLNSVLETSTSDNAKKHALQFVNEDGTWKDPDNIPTYAQIFGDAGKGVRETHPGTYWHSAIEPNREAKTVSYLMNDDGTFDLIEGTTDGLTAAGTQSWQDDANDMTVNYYTRPAKIADKAAEDAAKTPEEKAAEAEKELEPVHKKEWMRYAGLLSPAVGLGLQLAGVGKPNYSGIDAAIAAASQPAYQADWMPRGDFAVYRPNDPWFYTSPIMAQANAGYRSFDNSILPSKDASKLALGYNTMIALGNAQRQQLDSNFDKYMKTKQYNGTIYDANQKEYGTTSRFNADALNKAGQYGASLALQGANAKLDADAGWYNSLYGNVGGIFKGISDIGRENRETNWRNALVTSGAFGAMDPDALVKAGISKYKKSAAKGGPVKRKKRGLTI